MNNINILLRNGYVDIPDSRKGKPGQDALATVLMNLEYYGFALSPEVFNILNNMERDDLISWWEPLEVELRKVTGDDRNIGDFVVYKNFPQEVLDKSEAEYWIPQILMYWGVPNEFFTTPAEPREEMNPNERKSIILKLAKSNTKTNILNGLLGSPARWKKEQFQDVLFLARDEPVDMSRLAFKENLVKLAKEFIENGVPVSVPTATDVLRLGAGLSDGDVSLREKFRFASFGRRTRRFLLATLENCNGLEEDFARRPELWKRFVKQLHPGDYKKTFPRVVRAADDLYHDRLVTFNSEVERLLAEKNKEVLGLLSTRPGEFARRMVHLMDLFGATSIKSFEKVLPRLKVGQIVSLRRVIKRANSKSVRMFPPKGNWAKAQTGKPRKIKPGHVNSISAMLGSALRERVPSVQHLDPKTKDIKLPSNGSDEGQYNRGTVFQIPPEVEFIRSASYWRHKLGHGNVWFDNGWNFLDSEWKNAGSCCWTAPNFGDGAAAFSGDPTNSKDAEGRACQLIDIYPDKLIKRGVRYAVWNILCYSRIPFSNAEEVYGALQWGFDPQAGELFEPSRCQLNFQLQGNYLTKYVCIIDLENRKMVYLDANFKGEVRTAEHNGKHLEEVLPGFMEYIDSIPSVHDLFREVVDKNGGKGYILYSDKDVELEKDEPAYVFQREGQNDNDNPIDINEILSK